MLLFGHDQEVAAWVASRVGHVGTAGFGPCVAIGVVRDAEIVAGVVYHDYQIMPDWRTMQLSMAASSPRWVSRETLQGLLAYPFGQAGVQKLWTATPHDNERALKFNRGVGFRQEAVLRRHFGPKRHAVICSMLAVEWAKRWRVEGGQKVAIHAAAA